MSTTLLSKAIVALSELSEQANTRDPRLMAKGLTEIIAPLQKYALDLMQAGSDEPSQLSSEQRQHYRAMKYFSLLMGQLTEIQQELIRKEQFIRTVRRKGNDIESMRKHIRFYEELDMALQHLINLIQYENPEPHPWSVKNGYQFKSGGITIGRSYFGGEDEQTD